MARFAYSKLGLAAIVGGLLLTAIEVVGAVGFLVSQNQPSYLVVGGAMVTIVAAILPVLASRCWATRRYLLAFLLWMAMAPALSVIFTAAVERTGGARDDANRGRQANAQRIELARSGEREAKAVADADEAPPGPNAHRAEAPSAKVLRRGLTRAGSGSKRPGLQWRKPV